VLLGEFLMPGHGIIPGRRIFNTGFPASFARRLIAKVMVHFMPDKDMKARADSARGKFKRRRTGAELI
jgi:hypothetical protein